MFLKKREEAPLARPRAGWLADIAAASGVDVTRLAEPSGAVVYLVLDLSSSMCDAKLSFLKQGARTFARDATAMRYRVGVIGFNTGARLIAEPSREAAALDGAFRLLSADGGTAFAPALELARKRLSGQEGPRAVCLVTDGQSNTEADVETSIGIARKMKGKGIRILTIGTEDADRAFLRKLASHASLATHVPAVKLATAISDSARMLPGPTELAGRDKAGLLPRLFGRK